VWCMLRIKHLWLKLKICEHNWNGEKLVLSGASLKLKRFIDFSEPYN